MESVQKRKYCQHCKKETVHTIREDALSIEYNCHECNKQYEEIKTFF